VLIVEVDPRGQYGFEFKENSPFGIGFKQGSLLGIEFEESSPCCQEWHRYIFSILL
jgi:hypothetical protein